MLKVSASFQMKICKYRYVNPMNLSEYHISWRRLADGDEAGYWSSHMFFSLRPAGVTIVSSSWDDENEEEFSVKIVPEKEFSAKQNAVIMLRIR